MKLIDILRAGKARIERDGWCQGDDKALEENHPFGCCVATSMVFLDGDGIDTTTAAIDLFKRANGLDMQKDVAHWNDDEDRTLEEILTGFDKAITLAEQENV